MSQRLPLKTIGFWLAVLIDLFQALNALRAFLSPKAFADYMGLPLSDNASLDFVYVYGLRTAFIAIIVLWFAAKKRLDVLAVMALAAVFLPLGDMWLAYEAEAATSTLIRHGVIAIYLIVTFVFLSRAASKVHAL